MVYKTSPNKLCTFSSIHKYKYTDLQSKGAFIIIRKFHTQTHTKNRQVDFVSHEIRALCLLMAKIHPNAVPHRSWPKVRVWMILFIDRTNKHISLIVCFLCWRFGVDTYIYICHISIFCFLPNNPYIYMAPWKLVLLPRISTRLQVERYIAETYLLRHRTSKPDSRNEDDGTNDPGMVSSKNWEAL